MELDVVPTADVSIAKSVSPQVIDVGTTGAPVTYTLTVHNAGPQAATDISVEDPVDPRLTNVTALTAGCDVTDNRVSCTIATLASGAVRWASRAPSSCLVVVDDAVDEPVLAGPVRA